MIQLTAAPTIKLPAKVIGLESAYQPTLEQKISQLPVASQPAIQQSTNIQATQPVSQPVSQIAQSNMPEPMTVQAAQAQAQPAINEPTQVKSSIAEDYLPYSGALNPNEIALVRRLIERNTGATVSV